MRAVHLVIRGRVQGVGYRESMIMTAQRHAVQGWVRNRIDGSVEAFVQGDAAAVEEVVQWCARGPRAAQVTAVARTPAPPDASLVAFERRATA
jgi:acylphosphatase